MRSQQNIKTVKKIGVKYYTRNIVAHNEVSNDLTPHPILFG